ncbi:hypothetical protein [Roseibium sp. Sym1]|uniref:hypothetical protein n=1 Tax=Roseibium sp. Sym1 TaxID=3016006 RepID=UPI0022B47A2E|nr:hypothetical protein [Roseibium sp. Sym1]
MRDLLVIVSILFPVALLAGCQSTGEGANRPPDAWKYTALQKAEQDLVKMAEDGKLGTPEDGTWQEAKARATLLRLRDKYRSQGYR